MSEQPDKSNCSHDSNHEGEDPRPRRQVSSTRLVTVAGIVVALILIFLLAIRVSPTARFAMYTICSFLIMIVCLEVSFKGAALAWLASALLSLIIVGLPAALPYCGFFGPWPLIKGIIERRFTEERGQLWLGYVIKVFIFVVLIIALYFLFHSLILSFITLWQSHFGVSTILLGIAAVVLAVVYDVVLTDLLMEYRRRLRPVLFKRH